MSKAQTPSTQPQLTLLRLPQVLKIVPMSQSAWLRGVADKRHPAGIKLGPRMTCWRSTDIDAFIRSL